MKAKLFTKDMVFIDVIDISQLSFKRQRNKEYTISCKPIADKDYNWEQVSFIYFLDDNEEKTKRIQYKPCGYLEGYNGESLSIKSMESYLESISVIPENFEWWQNKLLKNVLPDLCYGFRRIKKASLSEMQDVATSYHVKFDVLENGNGEVYADTGYYFSPSNTHELYYYSDGYVIYRMTLPAEARRQGLILRWSDQTGTTTDVSVQFRWSNVSSDFTGTYSAEQSPLRGEGSRKNETVGVDVPESDNTYLFIKFNLKYDTGSTSVFPKGYNYEQEITTVQGEGEENYVYYGKTAILNAFEIIYRVDTRIEEGTISVSDTQLMQADLSSCSSLLSVLKAISEAYKLTFFVSFEENIPLLNVYNEYINDTTNQTIITDKVNSTVTRKEIKTETLQAVEAFGIGNGFDRIHAFVKADDLESNIKNIGKYEGEETSVEDLVTNAKAYIEKENEELSSASFEYYNMPLQVNDKVRVVINKNVYTSLITEENYSFDGDKTKKEYTIGIRKYAFSGFFTSPFSGLFLYKPEAPTNLIATRMEQGWNVSWQGRTQRYILQYRRSSTSPWNTVSVTGTNCTIPFTEYDIDYTFAIYAVDDRGQYSDAMYIYSNSLSEVIYSWETYNDSDSQPDTPTGEGNADGWHRDLTQEAKWMSKKESHRITEGTWSVPVLMPGAVKDGISTDIPDNVTGLTSVAMRDGIQIRCNSLSGGTKNIVNKYNFELLLEGSSTWISISSDTNSAFYTFDRSTIGYPEASEIDGSQVRCKVTNVYGYTSLSYATAAVSIVGYGTWTPVRPSSLSIVAQEKTLTLGFNQVDGSNYYGSTIYTVKLSYSGTTRVEKSGLREKFYIYDFNRSIDGYPEKTVITGKPYLGNYSLIVTAKDIVSGKTNISNTSAALDTSNYGTWIPTAPTVFNMQSGNRSVVVGWQIPLSSGIYIYGLRFYEIQISKDGTNWYKPETTKTGKVLESDWYNGTGQVRVSGVQFAQSLPLTGQTSGLPENTTYYYRVRTIGVTDNYVSAWSTAQTGIALATGIGDIVGKSVKEAQLDDSSVTTDKLKAGAITNIKISDDAITTAKIVNDAIVEAKIAINAVTTNKISNGAITNTKIADSTIAITKFASGIRPPRVVATLPTSPFTGYIKGDTVVLTTDSKLYRFNGTAFTKDVDAVDIVANSITAAQIATGAISTDELAANAVTAAKIASNTITANQIASNTITAGQIASSAITADEIAANAVTTEKIKAGAIIADKIASDAVTTDKLLALAVTTAKLSAGAVTAEKVYSKAITTEKLDTNAVTTEKINAGAVIADKIASDAVTTEKLHVLAKNKINNFSITGTLEGWTTTGTLEDDASGFKKLRFTRNAQNIFLSNVFTVQPNEICSFEFGISCPNYTSLSGAYIGLALGQSYRQYAWSFTLNKWTAGSIINEYASFIRNYKETTVKYFKTYILGSNVSINDIPAPAATDTTYSISALQLQGSDTTARLRAGFDAITAGTYWELYNPQIYSNQGGKIVAQQIITPSLSAINVNAGEITSGILRAIIKAGESKPNVFLDLDTEEFRVGNNPSLEDSNHADAEYLHWKPNVGLFLKLKNLIVDALASTIRGRFRVRGTTAEMAQSVLIVNPESTVDPDTNTPANTTDIKTAVRCPAGITGNLTGNADTADKWKTARNVTISDADGTNTGTAVSVDGSENETLKLPATIKATLSGNASTATLATQANAIKPLGNSITLAASSTSTTKLIKIASVDNTLAGTIKISAAGGGVADNVSLQFGQRADINGVQVTYSKYIPIYGINKIIVTRDGADGGATRNIYAECATYPNYSQTITLGVVERNSGWTFTPSMTEVSSVAGTVIDSVSLSYQRGEISSYQHVFTKNIIGNVTGNLTGNATLTNLDVNAKASFGDAGLVNATGTTDAVTGTPAKSAYFPNLYNQLSTPLVHEGTINQTFNDDYRGMAEIDGRLYAIGIGRQAYSDDKGLTWTMSLYPEGSHYAIINSNGRLIVCGRKGDGTGRISYSDNKGVIWTYVFVNKVYNALTEIEGRIIAVAGGGDSGCAYSDDKGATWSYSHSLTGSIYGITRVKGRLIAVGNNTVAYSDDKGVTWTRQEVSGDYRDIIEINGRVIAITNNGLSSYSDDKGLTWSSPVNMPYGGLDITKIGNRIIAVGTGGISYTDNRGATWSGITSIGFWRAIASIDSCFAVLGQNSSYKAIALYSDNAFAGLVADKLATSRKIGSVDFDGSADIEIPIENYSTTERRIGTWIDGKPLYRKVVYFGALPNSTVKLVAHGITNLDNLVRLSGVARKGSEADYLLLPHVNPVGLLYSVSTSIVGNDVEIITGIDRTNYTESKVIIEYTKTTD